MNSVYIHIDETLSEGQQSELKDELLHMPFVSNVEVNARQPHDMLVEFEPHHNMAVNILDRLASHGLHTDVMSA